MAAVLALTASISTSADLVGVDWILGPNQHPDGLHTTFQIIARFSDPNDQIFAVACDSKGNPLDFWTSDGSDMYNQELFAGSPLNDFPSVGVGGEPWDSYVTIGATSFPSGVQFSPNFLGDWGDAPPPVQVILGSEFYEDDGAWFFFGAPPEVGNLEDAEPGNDTFDVLIAQFTINNNAGFIFKGNIQWFNPVSGSNNTPFTVDIIPPTPGALALFGLAGLVGFRRRRG